ncbi:hypothetical protein ACQ4M4_10220 [Leptolyngbya sp. AN02str]|uniref:hypothetical protein n=1 Tax=Leptolyngbya sp. AN02str TaxID=3423363 RepID=UPI003D3167A7
MLTSILSISAFALLPLIVAVPAWSSTVSSRSVTSHTTYSSEFQQSTHTQPESILFHRGSGRCSVVSCR